MKIEKEISKDMVEKAMKDNNLSFANAVLYKLCKKNIEHQDTEKVIAKIWIIGRTYAAQIERQKPASYTTEQYYVAVAKNLKETNFDSTISQLQSVKDKGISEQTLQPILNAHSCLMKALRVDDENGKSRRSFCSKYLHFHFPKLFFLYDSMAATSLPHYKHYIQKDWERLRKIIINNKDWDEKYANYFITCYLLQQHINKNYDIKFSCRNLDNLLLYYS